MTRQQNIRTIFLFSLSILNIFLALPVFAEDTLTITTYYPSPYGVYRELRAKRIAIGDDYIDGANYTWQDTESGSGEVDFNADLVVEGNVGIGTVNPGTKLDFGMPGGGKLLTLYSNPAVKDYHGFGLGAYEFQQFFPTDSHLSIGTMSKSDGVTFSEIMRVTNSGNVGIGTTSPSAILHVEQSGTARSDGTFRFVQPNLASGNDNSILYGKEAGAGGLQWYKYDSAGASLMGWNHWGDGATLVIKQGGNVGIGTTSPGAKLEVNGTIIANGIFPDYTNGQSLATNTVYQAGGNGFLSVVAWGPYMNNIDIWVGPNSGVGILIWRMGDDINSSTKGGSALIPVKKGTYFKVSNPGAAWISQSAYDSVNVIWYLAN